MYASLKDAFFDSNYVGRGLYAYDQRIDSSIVEKETWEDVFFHTVTITDEVLEDTEDYLTYKTHNYPLVAGTPVITGHLGTIVNMNLADGTITFNTSQEGRTLLITYDWEYGVSPYIENIYETSPELCMAILSSDRARKRIIKNYNEIDIYSNHHEDKLIAKMTAKIFGKDPGDYESMEDVFEGPESFGEEVLNSDRILKGLFPSEVALESIMASNLFESLIISDEEKMARMITNFKALVIIDKNPAYQDLILQEESASAIYKNPSSVSFGRYIRYINNLNPFGYDDFKDFLQRGDIGELEIVLDSDSNMNKIIFFNMFENFISNVVMTTIANSSILMLIIADSSVAMPIIANSDLAMTAVADSSVAMTAIANSSVAMTAIVSSDSAVEEIMASPNRVLIWDDPVGADVLVQERSGFLDSNYGVTYTNTGRNVTLTHLTKKGYVISSSQSYSSTSFRVNGWYGNLGTGTGTSDGTGTRNDRVNIIRTFSGNSGGSTNNGTRSVRYVRMED